MTKTKESFLLYKDSLNVLQHLSDEQAGQLFKAIAAYQNNEELDLDPMIQIAFSPFENHFKRDDKKYLEICEKRAKAGAAGGAKSKRGSKQNKQMLSSAEIAKQTKANKADSDPDPDPESVPDPEPDNKKPLPPEGGTVSKANQAFSIFQYWCSVMGKNIGSSKLTPKREKAINARLKDGYTPEQIKSAIDGCRADPFSMGKNDRQKPFNDIELICRTGEKLESFLPENSAGSGSQFSGKTGRNIQTLQGLDLDG